MVGGAPNPERSGGEDDLIAVGAERRRGVDAGVGRQDATAGGCAGSSQTSVLPPWMIEKAIFDPSFEKRGPAPGRRTRPGFRGGRSTGCRGRCGCSPAQRHIGHFIGFEAGKRGDITSSPWVREDGVVAVLVDDGQVRQLVQLGAAFGHEQDAGTNSPPAGQALIDHVRDLAVMRRHCSEVAVN